MIRDIHVNVARLVAFVGCMTLLTGCYSSSTRTAFFADAPPPPITVPETPREAITTLTLDSYELASVEPAAGEYAVYMQEKDCAKPKGDVLGYQWGRNSVGLKVSDSAGFRYRLSLGEDTQFKQPCREATRWHGYAQGVFED